MVKWAKLENLWPTHCKIWRLCKFRFVKRHWPLISSQQQSTRLQATAQTQSLFTFLQKKNVRCQNILLRSSTPNTSESGWKAILTALVSPAVLTAAPWPLLITPHSLPKCLTHRLPTIPILYWSLQWHQWGFSHVLFIVPAMELFKRLSFSPQLSSSQAMTV